MTLTAGTPSSCWTTPSSTLHLRRPLHSARTLIQKTLVMILRRRSSLSHILNAPFSTGLQRQFSRYFNEFEELQLLGKGAFGAVIKVQNKLDGCYYAVECIQVNPASKQFRRIKGEVTLLSCLSHENIVRYYNAWIERHETSSTGILSSDSSEPRRTEEKLPQVRAPAHSGETAPGPSPGAQRRNCLRSEPRRTAEKLPQVRAPAHSGETTSGPSPFSGPQRAGNRHA